MPTDPHHTPIIQPSTSQPQKKQSRRKQRKDTEIPQSNGPTEPIVDEAANEENVPTQSNDPPLSRVNTLGSGEDKLKLKELMDLCTKLSNRVLDLETTKTAQAKEIASLKKRVKKLERKRKSKTPGMKRLFKFGRYGDDLVFDTSVLDGEEVFAGQDVVEKEVSTADPVTTAGEVVTTASVEVSAATTTTTTAITEGTTKPTATLTTATTKGILLQEPNETRTTRTTTTPITSSNDKGKGIMVEEPLKMKPKDQDKVETDYKLAQRLQVEEQEELTIEEKSKLFQQLLEKRRKDFAAKRVEERRSKPPTKAQQRKLFENAMKRVNTFVDMDTELVEGSEIREEESSSKRAVTEEDAAIDAIPLATKSAPIVGFQIHRKGRNGYYEIMRADGSAKTYLLFSQLLKEFDREDLENLWKLVKAKHRNTRPEEGYEIVIWVHFVRFEDMHVYMLVEKRYPLTPATITDMLNKKLKSDYWNEMCYQLLKLMTKQLKKQ
ncbi:hypothetical protein Tco_0723154 [Tanacetum coccineum]